MPIWLELLVLLIVTYFVGVAIGWLVWGRSTDNGRTDNG